MEQGTLGLLWLKEGVNGPQAPLMNVKGSKECSLKMPVLIRITQDPNTPLRKGLFTTHQLVGFPKK